MLYYLIFYVVVILCLYTCKLSAAVRSDGFLPQVFLFFYKYMNKCLKMVAKLYLNLKKRIAKRHKHPLMDNNT